MNALFYKSQFLILFNFYLYTSLNIFDIVEAEINSYLEEQQKRDFDDTNKHQIHE